MEKFWVEKERKPRRSFIADLLRDFEKFWDKSDPLNLKLLIANTNHIASKSELQSIQEAQRQGYPNRAAGVYVYSDTCCEDGPECRPPDDSDRFTVIRYIGKVTTKFDDERRTKRHARKPIDFSYRWFEIIPIPEDRIWLAGALEHFLIGKVTTTHNKHFNTKWLRRTFRES
jgi:hypothetical protein